MNNQENEPLFDQSLKKSNDFIAAKYNATITENKLMSIALTRIESREGKNGPKLEAHLYPGELKRLFGDPSNIYRELKKVSKIITGHTLFIEDGKGNFKSFAIVPNAEYENGVFTIEFNEKLKEHIFNLEKNYTTLELSIITNLSKNSSYKLYELLKKDLYKSKPDVKGGWVEVEYQVSELRFMIGVANMDDTKVQNKMSRMGNNIDWDELYETLDKKDRKYEQWAEFQRNILRPAQDELKEKSDLQFEYEGIRLGRAVKKILFRLRPNKPQNTDKIEYNKKVLEEGAKGKIVEEDGDVYEQEYIPKVLHKQLYEDYSGYNDLTDEDLDYLLMVANYDEQLVRTAIEDSKNVEVINNLVGWLKACIERGGYSKIETVMGSAENAKRIRIINAEVEEHKDEISLRMWEKMKQKAEFPEFLDYLNSRGISFEQLEIAYDADEKAQFFADWKMGRPVNL